MIGLCFDEWGMGMLLELIDYLFGPILWWHGKQWACLLQGQLAGGGDKSVVVAKANQSLNTSGPLIAQGSRVGGVPNSGREKMGSVLVLAP